MLRTALITSSLLMYSLLVNAQHTSSYMYNRPPLSAGSNVQLPLGSIKAKGWLLKQLELQRDGATGSAEQLYPEAENLGSNSDWLGGAGSGWERVPYYVKGLVALAYTLDDPALKEKAGKWINWTLDHQQESGLFGPPKMDDWWPRMPMLYAIQSYYEATADPRAIPFLNRYFKYQYAHIKDKPLSEWSKSRVGDNIEIVLWLYNITGDPSLIQLVEILKLQAYPWANIYTENQFYHFGDDFHTKHSVSVGQALKFPVLYAQLGDDYHKDAFKKGIDHLIRDHGQVTGIASGTEFLSGRSSFQGVETCTVVEWMQSLETAARVIHDARIGDRLELIAFNALPAQFSRDIKSHLYYSEQNQLFCKQGNSGFDEDYDGGILLSPYSGMGCCRYNMHMGWPYFVKNSWLATPDKGLEVVAYAPLELNAWVADQVKAKISVVTDYPFEEKIRMDVQLSRAAAFPLKFRIPSWCSRAEIAVNGKATRKVKAGEIFVIDRLWKSGDIVTLHFPMEISLSEQVNNSVGVERGPLVYGLKIDAHYTIAREHAVKGFYDYHVEPASAWNYGLLLDRKNIQKTFTVIRSPMPENPFEQRTTPIQLKIKAKQIPSWTIAYSKMHAFEVPSSPLSSSAAIEEITLTPYGSENIRISNFPVIGNEGKGKKTFAADFSDGSLVGWINYGGGWFIRNGALYAASNKGSWGFGIHGIKAIASSTDFDDFVYSADIKLNSTGDAGLLFRVSDQSLGADAYKGYYIGLDAASGLIQLGKSSGQRWTVLKSCKTKLNMSQTYRLKIVAVADLLKIYLNGELLSALTCRDVEFKTGTIGVRSFDCLASIDNIDITAVK